MISLLAVFLVGAAPAGFPPYEWLAYCFKQGGSSCAIDRPLTVEDVAWVHAAINDAMIADRDRSGEWVAFPVDRRGNCADYAVTYRSALVALGFDPSRLSFEIGWVGEISEETAHMVLIVDLADRGKWTLDQLSPGVYRANQRPYKWTLQALQRAGRVEWEIFN